MDSTKNEAVFEQSRSGIMADNRKDIPTKNIRRQKWKYIYKQCIIWNNVVFK